MKIDQFVAEIFQDRQRRRRTVDELPRATRSRETSFNDKIVLARFDPGVDQLRI